MHLETSGLELLFQNLRPGYGGGTFSPGLGSSLGLLQGQQEAVQQVEEALQHSAVA